MTGAELLAELSKLDDEALRLPVLMEGCDCWGEAGEVALVLDAISIRRSEQ